MKRLAILALLIASSAVAQQHPNFEQGVAANKLYQFGNLDTVNLFNGNLMIHLPIGPSYPVGPGFGYQLMLSYNSKVWDYDRFPTDPDPLTGEIRVYTNTYPDRRSNAGFGWTLSLGQLLPSGDAPGDGAKLVYLDSTGNEHQFQPSFHDEDVAQRYDCTVSGSICDNSSPLKRVLYSRDGSNLRLKVFSNGQDELDFPNGEVQNFDIHGRLITAVDAFGNSFSVTYVITDGLVDSWTLSDSHSRSQTVTYRTWTNGLENYKRVPAKVELTAFSEPGAAAVTATYTFDYGDVSFSRGCGDDPGPPPASPTPAVVPVLQGLTLPDGSKYSFTYHTDTTGCAQGAIASVQLPTGGTRKYEYQANLVPVTSCDTYLMATPRIQSKSDFKMGETTSAAATWTYAMNTDNGLVQVDALCPDPGRPHQQEFLSEELQVAVTSPEGHESVHYFSIWPTDQRENPDGFDFRNFGYPFTSFSTKKNGTRFLSSQEYQKECPSDCTQVLKRSSYVLYDGISGLDSPRVIGSRTVFHDDGGKYLDTDSSDYDGYGHLRTNVTSSTFAGTPSRTVTTRYNPFSTANGRKAGELGLMIGRSAPWILDTYDRTTTTEGTASNVVDACFDATGFLTGRRTYKNTGATLTASTNDVVTTFTKKTTGSNRGFVADEHWFGGDQHPLSPSNYSDLCTVPTSTQDYEMDYTYDSGVLKSSQYSGMNWMTADRTIDSHTGLVYKSRDSSEVETTFLYDASGRVQKVTPAGRAWTEYTYNVATGLTPPATFTPASFVAKQCPIGATTCASPLTESRTYFDDFGRVVQSKSQMPDGWSTVNSSYDALGRAIATSMPEYTTTSGYQPAFAPAHVATTTYDAFDRPLKLTAADGKDTTFAYTGTSKIIRTTKISTSSSTPDTDSATTEHYDGLGRLSSVDEPAISGTTPNSTTTYTYDIGARLSGVSMVAGSNTQSRSFVYDGRGFLQSEQHPELGIDGNGTTTYTAYDARGHAGKKRTGPVGGTYDLSFTYDSAERLTGVSDAGGSHPVKAFTFGDLNGTGSPIDYRKGKLVTAVRYNSIPAPVSGDVAVTETYKYINDAGLPSERDTEVKKGTTTLQSFIESFAYDSMGAITAPGYPTCLSPCSAPAAPATNGYTNGFLTGVTGFASLGAYNANGTLGSVAHSNNVTDTITPDDSGMPRPKSIAYAGWTTPPCSGPSTPTVTAQSTQLGTNNQGTTLAASATACSGTLTYQWYRGSSGDTSAPLGTSSSYATGPLQTTTRFWVRVTDSTTNSASSATTVITICDPAAITTQPQSTTLDTPNQGIALSVVVNGCGTISYQWYRGSSGDTSTPLQGTAATYATGSLTSTTNFWVKVTDSSGPTTINSSTAVITVNTLCTPQVTEPPQNQTINAGSEASLHVAVTGCTGRNFNWWQGPEGNKSASIQLGSGSTGNGTSTFYGFYPPQTVSVWVEIYGDSLNTVTRAATITVVPPVPTGLNAYVTPGQTGSLTSITVTWQSTGADHYQLQRCSPGCSNPFTATSGSADPGRTPNTTYVYRVRSVDSSGNGVSDWSAADLATTMRFAPLQSFVTTVQFAHLTELLNGLNAVLAASGSTQLSWQNIHDHYAPSHPTELFPLPAANGPICAAHLKALRIEMTAARGFAGVAAFPYTDALTTTPPTPIRAIHFRELQDSTQ
ncbi:MAG: fibronectin type III domain-containing protein [Acidobacteria bacterium]|nr:fibronectin type III domain-containing protein [Acidobacteriota bacterium]MBV9188276.1 fibronectin type III domain-containing protein [Acidobacteriota bacterium]